MIQKAIVFGRRLAVPADVFELGAFRRWSNSKRFPKRGRISFLNGRIEVDMGAEHISSHVNPKNCVTTGLTVLAEKYDLGEVFCDGTRLVNVVAGLSVEPDAMFCRWETLEGGRVMYAEDDPDAIGRVDLLGAPDLVVEIVSDSSVIKDGRHLRSLYFAAGIDEYWLIDCRSETIRFELLTRGEEDYRPETPDADGFQYSTVFDRSFRLLRNRNRASHWRYQLEHTE